MKQDFVTLMNQKTTQIGMTNTHFNDCCGLSYCNIGTAEDVAKLYRYALAIPMINNIWSLQEDKVTIWRAFEGKCTQKIESTFNHFLGENIRLGGGKTGSDGYVFNIACHANIAKKDVVLIVLNAKSAEEREEIVKMAFSYIDASTSKSQDVQKQLFSISNLKHIAIYLAEIDSKSKELRVLLASNEKRKTPLLSLTKLMTSVLVVELGVNLNCRLYCTRQTYQIGACSLLSVGDGIMAEDAMKMLFLPSSNTASCMLAEYVASNHGGLIYSLTYFKLPTISSKLLTVSYYRRKLNKLLYRCFPMLRYWDKARAYYSANTDLQLSYLCPKNINEKLMWLTRFWRHPLKTKCADKFLVREYVRDCGLESLLVPLIGVYDRASEIDFDQLPDQFVLKCNHGSGYNIICLDKTKLNKGETVRQLDQWMSEDFSERQYELHYKNIPRKIVCEQLISSTAPMEYQMWCINGEVDSILACRKNFDGSYNAWSYSVDWKHICERLGEDFENELDKPQKLDLMKVYAKKLSKPFPFVRVDFYEVNGKIYFAELTFSPAGNILSAYKRECLLRMGKKLTLPIPRFK